MEHEVEETKRTLAGNFELTLNLSNARGLRVTGYLYSDDSKEEVNKRLDAASDYLERQAVRADIVVKRAQIAQNVVGLAQLTESYAAMMDIKNAGRKLTSQQLLMIKNNDTSVAQCKATIESLEAAIKAANEKYGFE